MSQIQEFYNQIQFPGPYTLQGLDYHTPTIKNVYLKTIDDSVQLSKTILDVGCGTGLISNLFARRYPDKQFTAIDFADSIEFAKHFAHANNISNVTYIKKNFLSYSPNTQFDLVVCQGVLHHIPEYPQAIENLTSLVKPGGRLVLGVYHPWGKILKKFVNIDYGNNILYQDQELNPFELSFNLEQTKALCQGLRLVQAKPSVLNRFISPLAFLNYSNGGLVTYTFVKNNNSSFQDPK